MRFIYLITFFFISNAMVAENLNISTTSGVSQGFLINGVANWDDINSGSLDERAKAYLEINCGHCHRQEGPAGVSGLNSRLRY